MAGELQHMHRHQDGWSVWAEAYTPAPDTKFVEIHRCEVCQCRYSYVRDLPIPEGMATEPPTE